MKTCWSKLDSKSLTKLYNKVKVNSRGSHSGALRTSLKKQGLSESEILGRMHIKTVDINKNYIQELWCKQKGRCAESNVLMETKYMFKPYNQHPLAPSIDRVDNSKGYVKGNVKIILLGWNRFRGALSNEEWHTIKKDII